MNKEIVFSIGNTNIRYALFEDSLMTESGIYSEHVKKKMQKTPLVKAFCISVNSKRLKKFKDENKFLDIIELKKENKLIKTEYDADKIGIDRFVTVLKCLKDKTFPALIIDTGTADTFDYIDKNGNHIGGFITPGLTTMAKSLAKFTFSLKEVEPEDGELRVGRNTEEALKYGIYTEWVTGVISFAKMGEKLIGPHIVIVCGGNASKLRDFLKNAVIDENYLLKSIYEYAENI